MRLGPIRINRQRMAKARDRLFELPLVDQGRAEVVMARGRLRGKLHRAAQRGHRLIVPPQRPIGRAQVVEILLVRRIDGDRAADVVDRLARATRLQAQCAEQMQRVGVLSMNGQELHVEWLGQIESASAMMLERGSERAGGDVGHGGEETKARPRALGNRVSQTRRGR